MGLHAHTHTHERVCFPALIQCHCVIKVSRCLKRLNEKKPCQLEAFKLATKVKNPADSHLPDVLLFICLHLASNISACSPEESGGRVFRVSKFPLWLLGRRPGFGSERSLPSFKSESSRKMLPLRL